MKVEINSIIQSIQAAKQALDALEQAVLNNSTVEEPKDYAAMIVQEDEYGPFLDWKKHWTDFPLGTKFCAVTE